MNKVRDLVDLSKVYEAVKGPKLKDYKAKQGTKPGKPLNALPETKIKKPLQNDNQPKQPFFHKDSGPESADGFKVDIVDPKTSKEGNLYEPEKFSDNVKKSVKEGINNFMKDKSIFDKLYEDVMGGTPEQNELDAQELGIEPEVGDSGVEDTADEVSFSLPRDVAEKLHEALGHVLGGEEDKAEDSLEGGVEGEVKDESEENDESEEDDSVAGEAVDAEEIGHAIVDGEKLSKGLNKVSSGSNVVPSEVSTAGKKAGKGGDGKVTDKVGSDGDLGHPLVNQKKGSADSVKGKSNVVNSKIKGNNQSAFNV